MTETKLMLYDINETPQFGKLLLFGLQLMLSVFVATVLIAQICGVAVSGALFGAGFSTFVYLFVTGWKSPMFISNSGAFVAPVMIALAAAGYTGVAVGGLITCLTYCLFGLLFSRVPVENIYKVFPKALIGAVTMVIGITLMGFIGTYVQIGGETNTYGILIALFTAIAIALTSHYSRGIAKILPFLIGTLAGYALSALLTATGVCKIVDFSVFRNMQLFAFPDLAMSHWTKVPFSTLLPLIPIYIAFTVSAMMECLSDHAALGGIIGKDLYKEPGIGRIFAGEGIANLVSSAFGGLGACSYGEGVACVGFSRVASTVVTGTAALMLALLAFLCPIQAFIASIPSCVFGGAAIILYGYIACSGVKMLQQIDLNNQKNLIMVSSVLSLGISGLAIGGTTFALSGTALALVFGIVLNLILKEKPNVGQE
jgi:uracil permease